MSTPYARLLTAAPAAVLVVLGVTTAPAAATWTVRPGGPVSLTLTSGRLDVRDTSTGTVTGNLSHVQARLAGMGCSAVIDGVSGTASDGTVRFSYATSTAMLTVLPNRGNLHFRHLSGCAGLFTAGDPAAISGTLSVSPEQTITSP